MTRVSLTRREAKKYKITNPSTISIVTIPVINAGASTSDLPDAYITTAFATLPNPAVAIVATASHLPRRFCIVINTTAQIAKTTSTGENIKEMTFSGWLRFIIAWKNTAVLTRLPITKQTTKSINQPLTPFRDSAITTYCTGAA